MKIREAKYRNILSKILVIFFTTVLVSCTCLPFSSPSSKTPMTIGTLSYSNIYTYIGVDVKGNPQWSEWSGIAGQGQTLNYSISPSSHYVTVNKDTGEISVLANALFSNSFIVTATNYGKFQEPLSVSAELDVEVMLPFLYNVDNISDDDSLDYGDRSLTVASVGEMTYLFTGVDRDGMAVFFIQSDGSLVGVDDISEFDHSLRLSSRFTATTVKIGEIPYLYAVGYEDSTMNIFSVNGDGSLNIVDTFRDDANMKLGGAIAVTTAEVEGDTYLFVGGYKDDGVSVFSVANDGTLSNVDNVGDDDTLKLSNVNSVATAEVGSTTFLFASSWEDYGVSMFSVSSNGSLVNVTNVSDNDIINLAGARSITTAEVRGMTYLFVAGYEDQGVSVFSIEDNGTLINVDNVGGDDNKIYGAIAVTTAEVEGDIYLFVAKNDADGVSAFSVGDDGSLINVDNVYDNNILNLTSPRRLITTQIGATTYLIVAGKSGPTKNGISVFSINPASLKKIR